MKLTLLRHGITEGNRRRLYYGSTDLPLLRKGGRRWRTYVPKEATLRQRGTIPVA